MLTPAEPASGTSAYDVAAGVATVPLATVTGGPTNVARLDNADVYVTVGTYTPDADIASPLLSYAINVMAPVPDFIIVKIHPTKLDEPGGNIIPPAPPLTINTPY